MSNLLIAALMDDKGPWPEERQSGLFLSERSPSGRMFPLSLLCQLQHSSDSVQNHSSKLNQQKVMHQREEKQLSAGPVHWNRLVQVLVNTELQAQPPQPPGRSAQAATKAHWGLCSPARHTSSRACHPRDQNCKSKKVVTPLAEASC